MTLDEVMLLSDAMTLTMYQVWEPIADEELDEFDGRMTSLFLDEYLFTPLRFTRLHSLEEVKSATREMRRALNAYVQCKQTESIEALKAFSKLPRTSQAHIITCCDFFLSALVPAPPKEPEALP